MRMRTVLAIMAAGLGFMAAYAADVSWSGGGDGTTFTDVANWGGAMPATDDNVYATGATLVFSEGEAAIGTLRLGAVGGVGDTALTISGGSLSVRNFFTGMVGNAVTHVTHTDGTLTLTAGGDPGFAIGRMERAEGVTDYDTYALAGGQLVIGDCNANIGGEGYGEMTVTGGEARFGGYFVVGRYRNGEGRLVMTGGKIVVTQANRKMVIGEEGHGVVELSGTAELDASKGVTIADGSLSLAGNARLLTATIGRQNDRNETRALSFDGGTLVAKPVAGEATLDPFIGDLTRATMGDGGLTIDVPAGVTVVLRQPIEAAEGATDAGAGLTKTGEGTLVFMTTGNTYLGGTHVKGGSLILGVPGALDPSTIDYAEGMGVTVSNEMSDEERAAALAKLSETVPLTVFVADGQEMTLPDELVCASFKKQGGGRLVLTGANRWAGATRVEGGSLVATRGTGVPAESELVLAGGVWAPQTATLTGGFTLEPKGRNGFAAAGTALTVNLNEGAALTFGEGGALAGGADNGLVLNDAGADQPVRFENPLVLPDQGDSAVRVNATNPDAVATLAGPVTRRDGDPVQTLFKSGPGTLRLEATTDMPTTHLEVREGHFIFGPGANEAKMCDLILSNGGTAVIEPGANVRSTAWGYVGRGSGTSQLDIDGTLYINDQFRLAQDAATGIVNVRTGADVSVNLINMAQNGTAELNQTGGSVYVRGGDSRIGGWEDGRTGTAVYNLKGGTFEARGNFQVGAYSKGSFIQSELGNTVAAGWSSFGRYRTGSGLLDLGAGLWDQQACAVISGELGEGFVNVHDTGVLRTPYLRLGQDDVAHGHARIVNGGRVEAEYLHFNPGQNRTGLSDFVVDGGTIAARVDRRNFFNNEGLVAVGPQGLTFDTADHTLGLGYSHAFEGGPVTKVGSGTLQLGTQLPPVSAFNIAEGTVTLQGGVNEGLVHRWSFDGDLTDSVGGQTGVSLGGITFAGGKMSMMGGNKGTSGVDLGADILPKAGPVTLEFWMTIDRGLAWSKAVSIGSGESNYIILTGCTEKQDGNTSLGISGFMTGNDQATGFAERGREYHYAITWEPDGVSGMFVTATRRDATTGELLGVYRGYNENFRIASIDQQHGYLGRTFWVDPDLAGSFSEMRVWNRALTMSQLRTSAQCGPDVVPEFDNAPVEGNVVAANAGDQVLAHRWSFNNGNLLDPIGGLVATTEDNSRDHVNVTVTKRDHDGIRLAGGKRGTSLIDLGDDVLPKEGPVTIELWFTMNAERRWSQILDIGSSQQDYLVFGSINGNDGQGRCFLSVDNKFNEIGTLGKLVVGQEYHAAITLEPVDAGTRVVLSVRNAGTGASFGSVEKLLEGWTIANGLEQRDCWLGRSQFGDEDASVTYAECRIWNALLSDAQLLKNAQNGPDAVPMIGNVAAVKGPGTLSVAAGATLDLQDTAAYTYNLVGSGTVANGTLEIGGTLDPTGSLTLQTNTKLTGTYLVDLEDELVCDGDLDLSQATINIRNPKAITGPAVIARATGKIKGPAKANNLSGTSWGLVYDENTVRLGSMSTIVIIR